MPGTTAAETTTGTLADAVGDAPFVRLVASDDGDALAAAALLARVARAIDVPYQVRVNADPIRALRSVATEGSEAESADVSIAIGSGARTADVDVGSDSGIRAISGTDSAASASAFAVARKLGLDPDPVLALAGVVASDGPSDSDEVGDVLEAGERRDLVERRPGVALPSLESVEGMATGLAASTLVLAPTSGDPEAAREVISEAGIDETTASGSIPVDDHRRLASLLAVDVCGAPSASDRSATALDRVLRPYAIAGSAPFATVGGYADVLRALAREAPGTGIALAISESDPDEGLRSAALETWRSHGMAVHRALDGGTANRYDGVYEVRLEAPDGVLATAAEVVRDFRSPEPIAIAADVDGGRIAVAATRTDGVGNTLRSVADEFDAAGWGGPARGGVRATDATDVAPAELLEATREALRG
jgi:hypothetical protein